MRSPMLSSRGNGWSAIASSNSTRAYQGATSGVSKPVIGALERLTTGGLKPDLTLILDIPPKAGLARANARLGDEAPDRFEVAGAHHA